MFSRKAIVEIDENNMIKHEIGRRFFWFKYKSESYTLYDLANFHVDLKNRTTSVILEGQEVSVKSFNLPKVKKDILNNLIRDELFYHFKNFDNIIFTYFISKEHKSSVDVVVFCIDIAKINMVQNCLLRSHKINSIRPIQFCLLGFIKSHISEKNYAVAFSYKEYIYFLHCINNKMIHNRVYEKKQTGIDTNNLFQSFLENCRILSEETISRIYLINCEQLFGEPIHNDVACTNLGSVKEEQLLKSLCSKRR